MIDLILNISLLTFLAVTAVAIIRISNLFAVIMLFGIFSFLSATLFMTMDAVDVALTEAAVGAGISTVLMLATLALTKNQDQKPPKTGSNWLPLLVVLATGAALVYGTLDLPPFGDPTSAVHAHVAPRYIEQGMRETGVPNLVTAVLASYRGFDTLGEVVVIFTAGIAVLLLLGRRPEDFRKAPEDDRVPQNLILRVVSKTIIPLIMVFALYVQFHGDFGPGGGFQAGVIMSAALILYSLVFGLGAAERIIPMPVLRFLMALGVLIYAGVGVVSLFKGGTFLNYSVLADTRTAGQHIGIIVVELGVGITVFAVMLTIFFTFANRARP